MKEEGGLTKHSGIPLVDPRAPPPSEKELDVVWQRVYEVVAAGTCLDTEACERWMRKHRYAPPRFNSAAMLLQYVADARLDVAALRTGAARDVHGRVRVTHRTGRLARGDGETVTRRRRAAAKFRLAETGAHATRERIQKDAA